MSDITKFLGQSVDYTATYNPQLLVREDRQGNRDTVGFTMNGTYGYDRWNIYEASFLTNKNMPINGVGVLTYNANSQYIVESKSLKLYFFSYNMTQLGDTEIECVEAFEAQVIKDLSELLGVDVSFKFFHCNELRANVDDTVGYENIDDTYGIEDVMFDSFSENPTLLVATDAEDGETHEWLTTSLLRSNCKVTHQPDWGDLFLYYKGPKQLDHLSFIEYVVSFRGENHFHEEIVETAYTRLLALLQPTELLLFARYTRRGGIDINPCRATKESLIPKTFKSAERTVTKTFRQ
jgi:7-cyano-7-deazaguanine reductase